MIYLLKNHSPMEEHIYQYLSCLPFMDEKYQKRQSGAGAQSVAARSLLWYALQKEKVQMCRLSYSRHGKPYLKQAPEVHFSLSHCNGYAACIVSNSPVGIDIEKIRPVSPKAYSRVCTKEELQQITYSANHHATFMKFWCLKESYGKACGLGLSYAASHISFSIQDNMVRSTDPRYSFFIEEPCAGYMLAWCERAMV